MLLRVALFVAAAALAACAAGPDYKRPDAPAPRAYKEAAEAGASWYPAVPADALDRGEWWTLFDDTDLDALVRQVEVSNQNVAAAVAADAQARALVREQRAGLFPGLTLSGAAARSGSSGSQGVTANRFQLSVDASWAPDVWGRLGRAVESAQASEQASAADLAAARLSAQGQLATNYFALRDADAEIALLRTTVEAFERALKITSNRYAAGIAAKTDVLQAQTQLDSTRADLSTLQGQRAQLEHAIAVLHGKAPGDFTLAPAPWKMNVPLVPLGIPSALLQRRPDIAAAERRVAAANAQIGVQASAYYPSLTLSASLGAASTSAGQLFRASSSLWSLGASVAQTLFDAGATRARVEEAEAARDQAVAQYRQTVLVAFQAVEDQLAQTRALADQASNRLQASQAADLTEQLLLNRYAQGQVAYTDVVTAQATALSARRTLAQLTSSRQASAIALIQALGGGWQPGPAAAMR
jgi:NodT family efflux transporter outer membrane factor (OMF) lipoprotein